MTLEELRRDHALANAELNATRTKYSEAHDLQLEHNKMMLEYSVKSRDLSSEVKLRENKVLRIGKAIRTEKIKQNQELEQAQVQELKESQPSFWEVTANLLDEVVANKQNQIELTFTPERKSSDMLEALRLLTDSSRGYGDESVYLFEAKKQFDAVMTKVCLDQIKGREFNLHRSQQLKQPILQLLNNPQIKSVLQIS